MSRVQLALNVTDIDAAVEIDVRIAVVDLRPAEGALGTFVPVADFRDTEIVVDRDQKVADPVIGEGCAADSPD